MEFNIQDALPKKITDKYLSDRERQRKKKSKQAKKAIEAPGGVTPSDDSKSMSAATDNDNSERPKSRRVKVKKPPKLGKKEIKNIEQAQKKIEFWFD